jgi:transketolase
VLTRQHVPVLDLQEYPQLKEGVRAGGYVLAGAPRNVSPDITLVATGSEVHLALAVRQKLEAQDVQASVVSLPCWNIFDKQPEEYQNRVIPPEIPILAIEAGSVLGWRPYVGPHAAVIGIDRFGASAPGDQVMQEYGFNVDNVVRRALEVLNKAAKPG